MSKLKMIEKILMKDYPELNYQYEMVVSFYTVKASHDLCNLKHISYEESKRLRQLCSIHANEEDREVGVGIVQQLCMRHQIINPLFNPQSIHKMKQRKGIAQLDQIVYRAEMSNKVERHLTNLRDQNHISFEEEQNLKVMADMESGEDDLFMAMSIINSLYEKHNLGNHPPFQIDEP